MSVVVFDTGRNANATKYLPVIQAFLDSRPDIEAYVHGRVDQFMCDLLTTGMATMPNEKITPLFRYPNRKGKK